MEFLKLGPFLLKSFILLRKPQVVIAFYTDVGPKFIFFWLTKIIYWSHSSWRLIWLYPSNSSKPLLDARKFAHIYPFRWKLFVSDMKFLKKGFIFYFSEDGLNLNHFWFWHYNYNGEIHQYWEYNSWGGYLCSLQALITCSLYNLDQVDWFQIYVRSKTYL